MDKKQAGHEYAQSKEISHDVVDLILTSYIDGWSDCEAQQSPTDAIDFGIWLREHVVADGAPKLLYIDKDGKRSRKTMIELYGIFNSSGAAPQMPTDRMVKALRAILPYLKAKGTNGNHWVPMVEAALSDLPESTGPVWVKAKDRVPNNANLVHIQYFTSKTKFKCTGFYDKDKIWYGQSRYPIQWADTIEWLDESGQQLFTRERVKALLEELQKCLLNAPERQYEQDLIANFLNT